MTLFPFILCLAAFLTALINALTMRVIHRSHSREITASVELLIPMRNEERNVEGCISAALKTSQLHNFSIAVLNDNSSDNTGQLLDQFAHSITVIPGKELPAGWMGKNFALSQLAERSQAQYLIFSDADVRLTPEAISASLAVMEDLDWDFLSPYPRQLARSFAERLIQPLLQWSWMASVLLRLAERNPRPSTTIANGQFFIVKSAAYRAINGHQQIKNEVLDDLELARELVKNGFTGGVADASEVATCRMYDNHRELIHGYTKSLWRAFGSFAGTVLALFVLITTGITPLYGALKGSTLAISGLALVLASRVITALRTRSNPLLSLLHPLSITFLIYLISLSWARKQSGTLQWRGRTIS